MTIAAAGCNYTGASVIKGDNLISTRLCQIPFFKIREAIVENTLSEIIEKYIYS
jgi:hypothetical protein